MVLSSAVFFSKSVCLLLFFFSKMIFREYQENAKQFGSRSCRRFVGPDLGPNCLQR